MGFGESLMIKYCLNRHWSVSQESVIQTYRAFKKYENIQTNGFVQDCRKNYKLFN